MSATTSPLDVAQPITLDGVTTGRYRVETESSKYLLDFDRQVFTRTPRTDTADDGLSIGTVFELADGDTPFSSVFCVLYQRMVVQLAREPKCLTSRHVLLVERED